MSDAVTRLNIKREERGRARIVIAVLGVAALAAASLVDVRGVAEPPLAYDVAPLPAGLDFPYEPRGRRQADRRMR